MIDPSTNTNENQSNFGPAPRTDEKIQKLNTVNRIFNFITFSYIFYLTYYIHTQGPEKGYVFFEKSRNVGYFLLSILMLYIGVTINKSKKEEKDSLKSATRSLPYIVVYLILLTFSYPIALIISSLLAGI